MQSSTRKGLNTAEVIRTDKFFAPIEKKKNGEYKIKPGQVVYLCFQSDFLVDEADAWREECWKMIRQRTDLHFLFLTKRIERFMQCIPPDWENGYDNVTVCCTVENQARADERLTRGFTSITQYSKLSGFRAYCTLQPPVIPSSLMMLRAEVRSI